MNSLTLPLHPPSFLQRLNEGLKKSWTVRWGFIKVALGGLLTALHELVPIIDGIVHDPDVKGAVSAMNFPAYVGLGLAVLGVITVLCRVRAKSDEPV